MIKTVLGHYYKNLITLPNGERLKACPYKNILLEIINQKGFFLLIPFSAPADTYIIKNYVLVDDELYAQLTQN